MNAAICTANVRLLPLLGALALAALLAGCGNDASEVSYLLPVEAESDEEATPAFVPPEPPEVAWYDLPTGRREREADQAAWRDRQIVDTVHHYVERLVDSQVHGAADGLMDIDGEVWLELLGDRELLDRHDVLVEHGVTGRGVAAACLLLALENGHIGAARREELWNTLDRVVGISSDWPERPEGLSISTPEPARAGFGPHDGLPGGILPLAIGASSTNLVPAATTGKLNEAAARMRGSVRSLLAMIARLEVDIGPISIPREPPEGWNAASSRLFGEMPHVLRRRLETDDQRARVSSHAEMRGW